MRCAGLDLGDRRIGIAFSDPLCILATAYQTYMRAKNDEEKDLDSLSRLIKDKECDTIVVGIAVNMDGTEGERVTMYRSFGEKLGEKTGLEVVYVDEKLTTYEAEELLKERGYSREERKKFIDQTAAEIILQDYLDKKNRNKQKEQTKMCDETEKKGCDCGEECKDACDCGEECGCGEYEDDEIITLTDDNDQEIDFYQVATLDYKDKWYTFLEPVETPEGMEAGDLVVFEIGEDDSGDTFLPVEDEALLEELFDEFDKLLEEEDEDDEETEEDDEE